MESAKAEQNIQFVNSGSEEELTTDHDELDATSSKKTPVSSY